MRREYYDTEEEEEAGPGGGGEKGKKKGHSHPLIPLRAFRNTAYEAANSLGKC